MSGGNQTYRHMVLSSPSSSNPHTSCFGLAPETRASNIEHAYLDSFCKFFSKYLPCCTPHVLVAGGEDNFVRCQLCAVREQETMRFDLFNFLALLDFDLAVNDQLRSANIDVVPAPSLEIFHEKACRRL